MRSSGIVSSILGQLPGGGRGGEGTSQVATPTIEGAPYRQRLKLLRPHVAGRIHLVTQLARADNVADIPGHTWPPEARLQESESAPHPEVPQLAVRLLDDLPTATRLRHLTRSAVGHDAMQGCPGYPVRPSALVDPPLLIRR